MVAQNVQNQGISALSAAFSGKVRNTAQAETNFEKLLQNTKSVTAGKAENTGDFKQAGTSGTKAETNPNGKGGTVESKTESKAEKMEAQTEAVKDTDKVQTNKEKPETVEEVSDTELCERTAAFVVQVLETVQELLGLTDEELGSMLEELGMTEADLLQPDLLKEFYLNVKQAPDASALLTDASLLDGFQELNKAVGVLAEQSEIPAEVLMEQLEAPEFAEVLQNVKESKNEVPAKEAALLTAEASVTAEETKQPEEEKEITLEFKTESGTGKASASETTKRAAEPKTVPEAVQGEQFLQNLQEAVTQKVETILEQADIAAQVREIADQILERVRVVVSPETTSLEIQLTPEHLGKVGLTVSEQDGVLKAKFFAENELAKQAIESNLVQFKETLNEQGLKVESIEVMVSEFSFDKNSQTEQSGQDGEQRGRRHFAAEETEEVFAKPDRLGEHFLAEGESTVNYMA